MEKITHLFWVFYSLQGTAPVRVESTPDRIAGLIIIYIFTIYMIIKHVIIPTHYTTSNMYTSDIRELYTYWQKTFSIIGILVLFFCVLSLKYYLVHIALVILFLNILKFMLTNGIKGMFNKFVYIFLKVGDYVTSKIKAIYYKYRYTKMQRIAKDYEKQLLNKNKF